MPGNFPGSGNFLFPVSVDCTEDSVDWIMPGNFRVPGSVDWTEFSVDWITPGLFFSLIQMKSKLFQNATGRTLALRVYANRQPGPICSSMHHQNMIKTSKLGFQRFEPKRLKIGIFTNSTQTKSKCTWISVRNSYLTTKDNYSHRCEIKISPLNSKTMNEKLEDKGRSTTLQSQH